MLQPLQYATSTSLTNDGATVSWLLALILFCLMMMFVAMIWNTMFKPKRPWA
jgi:hypothetical protein